MVELQILSRILNQKSINILNINGITDDYFTNYSEEYQFIKQHFEKYGNVPDKETFLSKFPEFEIVEVAETDKYLIDTFHEEHYYEQAVPILNKMSEILQTDSFAAIDYLKSQLQNLTPKSTVTGIDIIGDAELRYNEYLELKNSPDEYLLPTGFQQVDECIGGFHMGEELVVVFARTGQGKSWVTMKFGEHAWKMNKRVGLIEPEMSASKTGYRFDTLHGHISNIALMRGEELVSYEEYIQELKQHKIPFFVAHPKDFRRKITVSKLRSFVETNHLDMLIIDGISYLTDERRERGDSRTTQLTNISEDLMDLSIEYKIPVIVVCQSNREGAKEDELELENIRDSDGIAYNASLVFSVMQRDPGLQITIKKNRNGESNKKFKYTWDINSGIFEFRPDDYAEDIDHDVHSRRDVIYDDGAF